MMLKYLKFFGIASVSALLFACNHENPLEKNALSISGEFLFQASYAAEKKINAGTAHGGYDYGRCVEGASQYSVHYCQTLYVAMVVFAKNQKGVFKDLTIDDLTEANAYFQVKGYYDNQTYMAVA